MASRTCKRCGKEFEATLISNGLCADCASEIQDKYHQVRDYLWDHPNTSASVVARDCNCSVHQVMRWVKEGRFLVSEDSRVFLTCENCGRKIVSGIFCDSCAKAIEVRKKTAAEQERLKARSESIHGLSAHQPDHDEGHMRFLH